MLGGGLVMAQRGGGGAGEWVLEGRERERGQLLSWQSTQEIDDRYPLHAKLGKGRHTCILPISPLTTFGGQSEASDWGDRMSVP